MISTGWGRLLARGLATTSKSSIQPILFRNALVNTYTPALAALLTRSLATTTTTTKKKTPTKKTTTVKKTTITTRKKPATKTAAAKKKPALKKKPAAKKKPVVKKKKVVAKKKKPVAKKRVVKKKAPEVNPITKARQGALKAPPRVATGYNIFFKEHFDKKGGSVPEQAKATAKTWAALSDADKARYNERGVAKRAELQRAYDAWVARLTPEQVRVANLARARLRRSGKTVKNMAVIKDERAVKRPTSAYIYFSMDVNGRADLAGLPVAQRAKRAGAEWKTLTDAQKKKYVEMAATDTARYVSEKKTVYG